MPVTEFPITIANAVTPTATGTEWLRVQLDVLSKNGELLTRECWWTLTDSSPLWLNVFMMSLTTGSSCTLAIRNSGSASQTVLGTS